MKCTGGGRWIKKNKNHANYEEITWAFKPKPEKHKAIILTGPCCLGASVHALCFLILLLHTTFCVLLCLNRKTSIKINLSQQLKT